MENKSKLSRKEILQELDNLIKTYEELPSLALEMSVTHYDLLSVMLLVSELFKAED